MVAPLPPAERVSWQRGCRIIRSVYPPIDLFEDIADPEDWPALIAIEQKTNPRLMASIGEIDRVEPARRVSGPGATYLMAPFTHVSPDRASRFGDGTFGVLYIAREFETALAETVHHHQRFMAATAEPENWSSQFREILLDVDCDLLPLETRAHAALLRPDDYALSQAFAAAARAAGANGIHYPSVRNEGGACVALFYPDCAANAVQGRHLGYHWNGSRVDLVRDLTAGKVYRVL